MKVLDDYFVPKANVPFERHLFREISQASNETMAYDRSVWENPDQERTNQNARIYLQITLPYNNALYF